jgi:UDP-N-acetyl-D-glucosamine dehydrogenase
MAGEINTQMPYYVVQRTMEALNARKKALNGSRILVLGAAYKKDVDDMRESPSLRVMALLQRSGAEVRYHDPHVPRIAPGHGLAQAMTSVPLTEDTLRSADAVLILTDHSVLDYASVVRHAQLVIDTRNAARGVTEGREHVIKA